MKKLSSLLLLLLLLQSCSVYHTGSLSVEEAVAANGKVKVITEDQKKYKFRRLEKENGRLLGITKPNSSTAKKLAEMPAETEGRFVKIDLSEVDIEKIKLRNNVLSTIISIAIPLIAGYLAVMMAYVALLMSIY